MNEDMGDNLGPEPCQPIGCDNGYHLPGCIYETIDNGTKEEEMTAAKSAKSETPEFENGADVTTAPTDWEWETVAEGSATVVIFEKVGDEFIGQYTAEEHIEREPNAKGEDQSFDRFILIGRDGERYALNKSYALEEAMRKVQIGQWCRILYFKEIPTARGQNPMKDFKVSVRK